MSRAYIDWGGTHFRCVVEGIVSYDKPTETTDIIKELEGLFYAHPSVEAVGISFAGQVERNIILSAPNIDVKELDLNAVFKNKKIFVQNDLKCALLAEAAYFNEQNIAALYVGTGIGSAYMSDGRLVGGHNNLAGEIGHIPYKDVGERCGCGKAGCLELTASGSALKRAAKKVGLERYELEYLKLSNVGREIAKEFEDGVGYAASVIITLLNPKILAIGGGIIKSNEYLADTIKTYALKNGFLKSVESCDIRVSKLENGSLDGARLLAL